MKKGRIPKPTGPSLHDIITTHIDIGRTFGSEFANTVIGLPVNEWSGPVRSGYGLHHVRIAEREAARLPELDEVLPRVMADMEYETGRASKEVLFQEIAQTYRVVLDNTVRGLLNSGDE